MEDSITHVKHLDIEFANRRVWLFAERGVYLPATNTLLVADTHFGKASVFGRAGIPVPQTTTQGTLQRIDAMLLRAKAQRLRILGDLWHGRVFDGDPVLQTLAAWREQWSSLDVQLVTGNHDRHMPLAAHALRATDLGGVLMEDGLAFRHDPSDFNGECGFAGHLHPVVRIRDVGQTAMRLPCFHVAGDVMILPAAGAFTGGHGIQRRAGDCVFACAEGEVIDVSRFC